LSQDFSVDLAGTYSLTWYANAVHSGGATTSPYAVTIAQRGQLISSNNFNAYSSELSWSFQSLAFNLSPDTFTLTFISSSYDGSGYDSPLLDAVSLQLGALPTFLQMPLDQVVSSGASATFTVQVTGYPPPSYQWQYNGANISNATNSTYTIASTTITNIGLYDVVISNSVGTNISTTASLGLFDINLVRALYLTGPIGSVYRIDTTSALGPTNWMTLTNVTVTTQPFIYIDYSSPTNKQRFYRAVPQ
jgi:hypothetical protein